MSELLRAAARVLASLFLLVILVACGSDDALETPVTGGGGASTSTATGDTGLIATEPALAATASTAGTALPTTPVQDSTPTVTSQSETMRVSVYFIRDEKIAAAHRELPRTEQVAAAAVEAMLAGPTDEERAAGLTTAIPEGTRYLGTAIEGTTATVNLSGEYESDGGSLSMAARLAQVVYTLTQFPTIENVRFMLDGEPIEVFGGEGIVMDQPVDRNDYEEVTPAILVESPTVGDEITSPLRVHGTANTFEAMFMLQIRTEDGTILVEEPVMATSGSGTRGTFDVTIRFDAPVGTGGTVRVFEPSARDGTPQHVVEIPIRFVEEQFR